MNMDLLKHGFRVTASWKLNKMLKVSASSFNTGRYTSEHMIAWIAGKFQVLYESYQIYSVFVVARTAHHWLQHHKQQSLDVSRGKNVKDWNQGHHAPADLPWVKQHWPYRTGGWNGLGPARVDPEILFPVWVRTPELPALTESLYWLCYTDCIM